MPNTSLRLPLEPPAFGFQVTPAFPGVVFSTPMVLTAVPGETNRLFVAERAGRIYAITNLTAPNKTLFLDLSRRVNTSGEGGLLGLAFHPGYATNGWFFVFYTLTTNTASAQTMFHDRVSRFSVDPANPSQARPESEVPLITQEDQASNHNGGDLQFGADGYLYVATGDEGGANDTYGNSRRIDRDFFSAVLRLDVDSRPGSLAPNPHPAVGSGYAIPPDNPFIGATQHNGTAVDPGKVRTEFWAVGLRNPWRMSFDPPTGRLYCGDVGQGLWEEVDLLEAGRDYGWNYREGLHPFRGTPPAGVVLTDPIWEYPHSGSVTNQGQSITGGVVYRGTRFSQLYGHYVFADYVSGNVWSFVYDGAGVRDFRRLTTASHIIEFGVDPANGDVLLASLDGPIHRLTYSDTPTGEPLPLTLADTGAFQDLLSLTPEPGVVPYSINASFWSDHAVKTRWFSVPDTNQFLTFNPEGAWQAPTGTVWVKHFELELTKGVPESRRRLETRFLVRNGAGAYGLTYRWDDAQTNAFLVAEEGRDESFQIQDGLTVRTQVWHYPARSECAVCHTPVAEHALSFNTFQLNREGHLGNLATNQITALAQLGYFSNPPDSTAGLPAFADATDAGASVEHRVRSYLAVNCVQCHQPGGVARGSWDARFTTPLGDAGLIHGALVNPRGNPANQVVVPGSPSHSELLQRVAQFGPGHMPPLATTELNRDAIALLQDWITKDLTRVSLALQPADGGGLQLDVAGAPNAELQLQTTPDLFDWQDDALLLLSPEGVLRHRLTPAPQSQEFYRILVPGTRPENEP